MGNPFETGVNKIPHSGEKEHSAEELSKSVEKSADNDFANFEKSNDDFIQREKERLNVLENNPEMESEILALKEKYKTEKKKLKSTFLGKLKKVGAYVGGSIAMLAFVAHFAKKEYPDYLDKSKEKEPKKIEWNESTEREIEKLAHEYTLIMKDDTLYKEIPDSALENRFKYFVATFGPDIEIVHPNEEMSIGNKIYDVIFEKVLRQREGKAHQAIGGTLFYENKTLKKQKEDTTKYDPLTSSLGNFIAEFSHHINKDWSLQRSFAYAEDLIRTGFKQHEMYEDPYSSEYQAHEITQSAIAKYLFFAENEQNIDFVDIYNLEQEYYREITKNNGYGTNEQILELNYKLLYDKKFDDITKDKQIVFQNLENARNSIDKTGGGLDKKSELFRAVIEYFPLEKSNSNFEKIVLSATELIEIKNKSLSSEDSFLNLAKELEEKFKNDSEYNSVSMTELIFDKRMLRKIDSLRNNDSQIEYAMKLYKLYIYGTLKAVEGNAFEYGNSYKLDNFGKNFLSTGFSKVRNATSSYEEYLNKNLNNTQGSLLLTRSDDIHSEKLRIIYFGDLLEQYIKNNKTELDRGIKGFSYKAPEVLNSWEYKTLLKLQKGLTENHSPDLKRDFFENGQSPLAKILE